MNKDRRSRINRVGLLAGAALVALMGSPGAFAQGWLAGAEAGWGKQYDYSVGGEISSSDDSDTAYRAFGGYLFHPSFGVVASWVDLGDASYAGPAFGGFTDDLSADGFDVSFLGGWAPGGQDRVTVFGLVGVFFWKQDVHYVDGSGTFDYNDDGQSLSFGVGTEIAVGSAARWGVNISWQRFTDVGDANNSGHEYDRDFIGVGFDYRFGK